MKKEDKLFSNGIIFKKRMNIMKGLGITWFVIFISLSAFSQDALNTPITIPPSPNAASLGEYGAVPVNMYTGIPQIDIPLFEVKDGDISVPISISYHSGGNKVGTIASWVGLGWTLNAGGVIARNMNGMPDEDGYFFNMQELLGYVDNGALGYSNSDLWTTQAMANIVDYEEMKSFYLSLINDWKDVKPDEFYYNCPVGSGKFVFDVDQKIHLIPYSNFKITASVSASQGGWGSMGNFQITDPLGKVYTFNEEEVTSYIDKFDETRNPFVSSWFLSNIYSRRFARNVSFTYDQVGAINQDIIHSQTITEKLSFETSYCTDDGTSSYTSSTSTISTTYLEEINWSLGKVHFYKSNNREDLPGAYKLDSISVFNSRNKLIKTIVFTYDYFRSGSVSSQIPTENHLKLMSVQEKYTNGVEKPKTLFTYEDGVPKRDSYAQDHWGFYNGAFNNTTLIPPFVDWNGATRPGGNREPDSTYTQAGILTKIQYPTGGWTEFKYEQNDCHTNQTYKVNKYTNSIAEDDLPYVDSGGNQIACLMCTPIDTTYFSTGTLVNDSDKININILYPANTTSAPYETSVSVYNQATQGIVDEFFASDTLTSFVGLLQSNTDYMVVSRSLVDSSKVYAHISWQEETQEVLDKKIVGGVRIKQIRSFGGSTNDKEQIKTYEYTEDGNGTVSSGFLINSNLSNVTELTVQFCDPNDPQPFPLCEIIRCRYAIRHAHKVSGGLTQGSHLGYKEVTEINGTKNNNSGWKRTTFSFFPDEPVANGIANAPSTSNDWRRGDVLKEQIYDSTGTLISEKINNYVFVDDQSYGVAYDSTHSMVPGFSYQLVEDNFGLAGYVMCKYIYGFYDYVTTWKHPDKVIANTYYSSGDTSKVVTEYRFDNYVHIQPTKTITYTSKGDTLETVYSYPSDYPASPLYDQMVSDNVLTPVINQYTFDQDSLIRATTKTSYGINYQPEVLSSGELPPNLSVSQYTTNPDMYLREERTFDLFDSQRNLLEETSKDGTKTSYLWGYNETLPIAKVVNATYSQLTANIAPADLALLQGNTLTDDQIRTILGQLREQLPAAQVFIYTYSPLVGISSTTDPNGQKTYYMYDDLNRLKGIEDNGHNLIKSFTYQYQH